MNELFSQNPKIELNIECYHIESVNDSEGRTSSYDKVTYNENINFDYYSWKDISGIFQLENIEAKNKKYPFIILEIQYDVFFGDRISIYDLNTLKDELIEKNKNRDKYIRVIVNKTIPGLEEFNLICIDPKNAPCLFFNKILYYILTLIPPLCEFYKVYLDKQYYCQTFKIRKVISTRNNLNNDEKYNLMIPWIKY